ncbi:MAG: hypothetical protein QOJ43_697 [Gaiellaceae bacterium]|nr:hypothetical protein [Gaiellaceae bacterium]
MSVLVLAAAVTAGGATSPSGAGHTSPAELYGYGFDYLARLDPVTLRVKAKLRQFATMTGQPALSPDGSRLVVGAGFMGDGSYAIAGTHPLRWLHRRNRVGVGPHGYAGIGDFDWLRPHRVFALLEGTGPVAAGPVPWTQAVILDVGRRHVIARRRLTGYVVARARDREREVLLLLGFRSPTAWQLVTVGPEGRVRSHSIRLPRASYSNAGFTAVGLAVDQLEHRAYLLSAGGPIAVVDLKRLRVGYRAWPARPTSRAKAYLRASQNHYGAPVGPMRQAAWLGGGVIAVSGEDDRLRRGAFGETLSTPYGVELIDTRDWTAKVVTPRANGFGAVGGVFFPNVSDSFGEELDPPPSLGLRAFSRAGRQLFHIYGREAVSYAHVGKFLYVRRRGGVDVLRDHTGKRLRTIPFSGDGGRRLFPAFGR